MPILISTGPEGTTVQVGPAPRLPPLVRADAAAALAIAAAMSTYDLRQALLAFGASLPPEYAAEVDEIAERLRRPGYGRVRACRDLAALLTR